MRIAVVAAFLCLPLASPTWPYSIACLQVLETDSGIQAVTHKFVQAQCQRCGSGFSSEAAERYLASTRVHTRLQETRLEEVRAVCTELSRY